MNQFYASDDSEYLHNTKTWHVEDSPYKARHILSVMKNLPSNLPLRSVAEVGCGAGEILNLLHAATLQTAPPPQFAKNCVFKGFDIAPDAIALCESKEKEGLSFYCGDFFATEDDYDCIMLIDVFEHVDDFYAFLQNVRARARYFLFNIPLEICALGAMRNLPSITYKRVGHKHFFMKKTALYSLEDCGFKIMAYEYGLGDGLPAKRLRGKLAKLPRKILYSMLPKDCAVRLLGGSLFVLAQSQV